jgi:stage IV sporulation protein FB
MFRNGYEIGRVFGVPIRLDASLIILALVYAVQARSLTIGVIFTVVLMASVALHELGHTYTALKFGCRVRDITLMLIGGRASLLDMPREPWKEFVLAASGPLVSAVLWLGGRQLFLATGARSLTGLMLYYLSMVNMWLLLFNLLPAFPMDGGRMLRALLARRMGRLRATFIASRIGRLAAVLMGLWGLFHRFDIFLMLIAVYIYQAAGAEYRMVQAESGMGGGGFFFGGAEPPPDDQVIISPPPYRRGRDVADIFKEH